MSGSTDDGAIEMSHRGIDGLDHAVALTGYTLCGMGRDPSTTYDLQFISCFDCILRLCDGYRHQRLSRSTLPT